MKEYNVCVQTFMMLIMMTLMYVWFKLLNNMIFTMGWGCAKKWKKFSRVECCVENIIYIRWFRGLGVIRILRNARGVSRIFLRGGGGFANFWRRPLAKWRNFFQRGVLTNKTPPPLNTRNAINVHFVPPSSLQILWKIRIFDPSPLIHPCLL